MVWVGMGVDTGSRVIGWGPSVLRTLRLVYTRLPGSEFESRVTEYPEVNILVLVSILIIFKVLSLLSYNLGFTPGRRLKP